MKKLLFGLIGLFATSNANSHEVYSDAVQLYIRQSIEGLKQQTSAHNATWHFGKEKTWSVDQDNGLILFIFPNKVIASAPVQIIGTYDPNDGSFLWGWDNPSVDDKLKRAANLVKAYGVKNKIAMFTKPKIFSSEEKAWEFVALAARLDSANGAYRAKTGGPIVYMTFGEITLKKQP